MSIWNKNEIKTDLKSLNKNEEFDILIIGAGMTGMNCAYYLKDKNVCIVDASRIGHGVTLNSTAKINYFQERIYTRIKNIRNEECAKKYLESQLYAIKSIKNIIESEKVNCNFKEVESYVFASTKDEIEPLKKEIDFLRENNIKVYEKKLPIRINSYKSYCVDGTYIFNPIKYLQGLYDILNKKISIYENTKITNVIRKDDCFMCYGTKYSIKAKKVIFACHYPYFIYPFLLPFKSSIEKSYMIVSKVKDDKGFTCISSNNPIYSIRYYNDGNNIYKISLAESHNTSIKQNDTYHFNNLKKIFNIKEKDIVYKYSNTDIMTPDYMPYIGILKNNMYIACGYNTWGMTNSVLAASIISDLILNNKNDYVDIFNPNRVNISNVVKFPIILFGQIKSFLGPKVFKYKPWYSDRVTFYHENGKSLAKYKDKNGFEHIIYNKCPHFGCSLIFNEKELTWDCPCHSSRFNIDGKCIKGPSNYDISYPKK